MQKQQIQQKRFTENQLIKQQKFYQFAYSLGILKRIYPSNELKQQAQSSNLQIQSLRLARPVYSMMPIGLYPYTISKKVHQKIRRAHSIWNRVLPQLIIDQEYLNRAFKRVAQKDDFVGRILQLYNQTIEIKKRNPQAFKSSQYGVFNLRVDYMNGQQPNLIQFNTTSIGLNGISDKIQLLHTILSQQQMFPHGNSNRAQDYEFPASNNQTVLSNCLQTVFKLKGLDTLEKKKNSIILMVVHPDQLKQFNFCDQNNFIIDLGRRGYQVERTTMTQMIQLFGSNFTQKGGLPEISKQVSLCFKGKHVIGVYFRTTYDPTHFKTEEHWLVRKLIELSDAVAVPSIGMQLVNFKRMQVQLSKRKVLRKYLSNEQEVEILKSTAGQIYDFDSDDENQQSIQKELAGQKPMINNSRLQKIKGLIKLAENGQYVLKQNRQGGGHNLFGEEALDHMKKLFNDPDGQQKLRGYILMKKVKPQVNQNIFVLEKNIVRVRQTTAEFSTFGAVAYHNKEVLFDDVGGALIRLKRKQFNEGGIARDLGAITGLAVSKQ